MLAIQILKWLLLGLEIIIAAPILYLCIVTISAILSIKKHKAQDLLISPPSRYTHFAILVPAHDEIAVLGNLLESLQKLNYPRDQFTIHIVADNCTDATATLARTSGWVHVYERFDSEKRGKGYALRWLFQQLEARQLSYEAYVILDADTVVDSTFLLTMNEKLLQGQRALQAHNTVLNIVESPSTALRWIALSLINFVRPLGRNGLGGTSTLTGNGMCFSRELLQQHPWQTFSLTEDYQYYLTLVQSGERVCFVPEATVRSVMPTAFAQMRTQDIRWESISGHEPKRKTVWRLLKAGIGNHDYIQLEAIIELLTPPFSLLATSCLLALIGSLALLSLPNILFGLMLTAGLTFYLSSAFYLLRPPRTVYIALFHAPGFILWKLWVLIVLRGRKKNSSEWIRTSRTVS